MAFSYGWEQFCLAITYMARSPLPLRERLCHAYRDHLIVVHDRDIPEELRHDMATLREMLTHRPARNETEGKIQATTDQMTDHEADRAAQLIMHMFFEVESRHWEETSES